MAQNQETAPSAAMAHSLNPAAHAKQAVLYWLSSFPVVRDARQHVLLYATCWRGEVGLGELPRLHLPLYAHCAW